MKQLESLVLFETISLPAEAANDPLHPPVAIDPVPRPAGWDPFEIWRTRVRDARREPEPSARS
jgi:hypothetical protein